MSTGYIVAWAGSLVAVWFVAWSQGVLWGWRAHRERVADASPDQGEGTR